MHWNKIKNKCEKHAEHKNMQIITLLCCGCIVSFIKKIEHEKDFVWPEICVASMLLCTTDKYNESMYTDSSLWDYPYIIHINSQKICFLYSYILFLTK